MIQISVVSLTFFQNTQMKKKRKARSFPFCPENKICNKSEINDYMKKLKPDTHTQTKKLFCEWTIRKK